MVMAAPPWATRPVGTPVTPARRSSARGSLRKRRAAAARRARRRRRGWRFRRRPWRRLGGRPS
eukprot:5564929-Prymnesium_polylepis.1